ncbi:hypothetical protein like AT1G75280 [Hibiscus trionum]|uniref:NmrA-like domain-containing protein n=1 Tax=Hibiscus trionum TaxID=183268 RepID=A0A9W7IW10_HIBTR|nr:hypothetical protein like AT1G75280 [Hibiscus trionum]
MDKEASNSKIPIFGGIGYLGTYMVKASIKSGHQTFVYGRPITPHKINLHNKFRSLGFTIVEGELDEHDKMVAILRQVDIVISLLPFPQVLDQIHIIEAIKVAGNITRFLPQEFGVEEDRLSFLLPFEACLDKKRKIRRAVEACVIPYTYVSANICGVYFINHLLRPHDDMTVYGFGEAKVLFNYEEDIVGYTIKVANDLRTHNRIMLYRTAKNVLSQNVLISLWEKKTGRSFKKTHVSEEELVRLAKNKFEFEFLTCLEELKGRNLPGFFFITINILMNADSPFPDNVQASLIHGIFVKGCLNYDLRENDLETSSLYPDYEYTTIEQLLDIFLPALAAF